MIVEINSYDFFIEELDNGSFYEEISGIEFDKFTKEICEKLLYINFGDDSEVYKIFIDGIGDILL